MALASAATHGPVLDRHREVTVRLDAEAAPTRSCLANDLAAHLPNCLGREDHDHSCPIGRCRGCFSGHYRDNRGPGREAGQ